MRNLGVVAVGHVDGVVLAGSHVERRMARSGTARPGRTLAYCAIRSSKNGLGQAVKYGGSERARMSSSRPRGILRPAERRVLPASPGAGRGNRPPCLVVGKNAQAHDRPCRDERSDSRRVGCALGSSMASSACVSGRSFTLHREGVVVVHQEGWVFLDHRFGARFAICTMVG